MRLLQTLRSAFTFSNVLSVVSACVALTGTGATIYYNFYWHPEQLQVSYRILHEKIDTSQASFIFTNNGRQAVAVETVKLMKAIESTSDDACERASRHARKQADDIKGTDIYDTLTKNSEWVSSQVQDAQRPKVEYFDTAYEIKQPINITIDNKDSQSTSLLVEAQSAKVLNLQYAISFDGSKDEIYCFQINVFDRLGVYHTRIMPAWKVIKQKSSDPYQFVIYYGQDIKMFSLLPAE